MLGQLQPQLTARYNQSMPRENKTEKIVLRVRPSFKKKADEVADATGQNVTEMFEEAFKRYLLTKDVRDALAALAAEKE